jgi:AbiU2
MTPDMFKDMSVENRIKAAKEKTKRVLDHLLYLLELHENNAIIFYSPTLSSQIPTSYAANAFNVIQRGLHQFEIVRLCTLWDRAELNRENIPTIIALINHPDVIEALAQETLSQWSSSGAHIAEEDPELRAYLERRDKQLGEEQAEKARVELRKAFDDAGAMRQSPKLTGIMNLRDKHLAHSLSQTYREQKGPIEPMRHGDERDVLEKTLPLVEALYCWVNCCSFSLEDSRNIHRKNAKALWMHCRFEIKQGKRT